MKRRWFRYSLRSLLVLVTLSAVAIGWYTHRQRIIRAERGKILGGWKIVDFWRADLSVGSGYPIQLSETDFQVGVPSGNVGSIDFRAPAGEHSKGIYCIDGDLLKVAQNDVGEPRPTTFSLAEAESVWTAKRVDSGSN